MKLARAVIASALAVSIAGASNAETCARGDVAESCTKVTDSNAKVQGKRKGVLLMQIMAHRKRSATPSPTPECCSGCEQGYPAYCSNVSGNCYPAQNKPYYKHCPNGGQAPPSPRLENASSTEGAIKFMSYNLFGWNAFNNHMWKSDNILKKVKDWSPAVLGAQEVETGGGAGGEIVSAKITSETGMVNSAEDSNGEAVSAGLNQFFDSSIVEVMNSTFIIPLEGGYWMSMTRFKHIATNVEFLFFNSHWKHGHSEQKDTIANAIDEERQKYDSPPPTILVGDTNQFCMAADLEAIQYLTSEESPVTFIDAMAHDKGSSYTGGCRIDFVLASKGQWQLVQSSIDREGMTTDDSVGNAASDHAALMAELVPVTGDVSLSA